METIFQEGRRYSSSRLTTLVSTTFKLCGSWHCIHCGQKALPVQAGLVELHPSDKHYETTDYRCNCENALDEIANLIAMDMTDTSPAKPNIKAVPRDLYLKILGSASESYLPLTGGSRAHSVNATTPVIVQASNIDSESFLKFIERYEKNIYFSVQSFKETPVGQFLQLIETKAEQYRVEQLENLQREINKFEKPISLFN
ncbi:hypothetical protein [Vibrio harveyi]|uniref:hypothetical protein n=1 Tax=Vibrio harveyi TaxID=669 RepID=UPI003CF05784